MTARFISVISLWKWFLPGLLIGTFLGFQVWLPKQTIDLRPEPQALSVPAEVLADREQTRSRLSKWAEQDPDAAWEWAFSQTAGDLRDQLLDDLIYGVGKQDPVWGWERALSLPQSGHRVNLLGRCLESQAKANPDLAKAWFLSFPSGAERDQLLVSLLNPVDDAAEGLALILELSSTSIRHGQGDPMAMPPISLSEKARDLVTTLGREKPREALAWIGILGLQHSQSQVRGLIARWHYHSPEDAKAWIDRAPPEFAPFLPKTLAAHHEK